MSEPTEPERLRAEAPTPIADDLKDALRRQACGTDHVFYQFREMERALSTAASTADKLREENEELKQTNEISNILLRAGTAQLREMVEIVKENYDLKSEAANLRREVEELKVDVAAAELATNQIDKERLKIMADRLHTENEKLKEELRKANYIACQAPTDARIAPGAAEREEEP